MTEGEWNFLWRTIVSIALAMLCGGLGSGILFPGGHAREPAHRAQSINNLKYMGIAYTNEWLSDPYARIPPVAIVDAQGQPLLSWRVLMLPLLGEQELFEKFDLTKRWDSSENLPLVTQMPPIFESPFAQHAGKEGRTPYKAIVSDDDRWNTAWPKPGEKLKERNFKDGMGLTALVVEDITNPVIWTKPEEITPGEYLRTLDDGRGLSKSFLIGFADGSVRVFQDPSEEEILPFLYADDGMMIE